jgi:hypothetical protein
MRSVSAAQLPPASSYLLIELPEWHRTHQTSDRVWVGSRAIQGQHPGRHVGLIRHVEHPEGHLALQGFHNLGELCGVCIPPANTASEGGPGPQFS